MLDRGVLLVLVQVAVLIMLTEMFVCGSVTGREC